MSGLYSNKLQNSRVCNTVCFRSQNNTGIFIKQSTNELNRASFSQKCAQSEGLCSIECVTNKSEMSVNTAIN